MDDAILGNLRTAYDAKASERDAVETAPWKAAERVRFLTELNRQDRTRLLEIGSGPGRDGLFFQNEGLSVVCTDLSPNMVSLCRRKGLEARVMDCLHLDFPECSFDAVFALNSLLHVPKASLRAGLDQINRLLRPGGLVYVGVYGGEDFEGALPSDDHEPNRFFSFYTDIGLLTVLSSVFELVYFRRVDPGWSSSTHFQSLIVRKKAESPATDDA